MNKALIVESLKASIFVSWLTIFSYTHRKCTYVRATLTPKMLIVLVSENLLSGQTGNCQWRFEAGRWPRDLLKWSNWPVHNSIMLFFRSATLASCCTFICMYHNIGISVTSCKNVLDLCVHVCFNNIFTTLR